MGCSSYSKKQGRLALARLAVPLSEKGMMLCAPGSSALVGSFASLFPANLLQIFFSSVSSPPPVFFSHLFPLSTGVGPWRHLQRQRKDSVVRARGLRIRDITKRKRARAAAAASALSFTASCPYYGSRGGTTFSWSSVENHSWRIGGACFPERSFIGSTLANCVRGL